MDVTNIFDVDMWRHQRYIFLAVSDFGVQEDTRPSDIGITIGL